VFFSHLNPFGQVLLGLQPSLSYVDNTFHWFASQIERANMLEGRYLFVVILANLGD
jgi:hypothetical protein